MPRRVLNEDEIYERLKIKLEKSTEALRAYETRLSEIEKERERLTQKIKGRKAEVEKYQGLTKERQYSDFEEALRLKGISIDDITKAIANGDTKYLLELTERTVKSAESTAMKETENTVAAPAQS